jgi:alanyl-tRNA synthetase
VDADKTRFDFTHTVAMTPEQIAQVEQLVNAEILANAATSAKVMNLDDAQKTGAMMLFGEKYGESVRVLEIGSSKELCGGTHVQRTGDIGIFKILSESGVAAGIRLDTQINQLAISLKATPSDLAQRITQLQDHARSLEKELERLGSKLAASQGDELMSQAVEVNGVKILAALLEGADAKVLRETLDQLKNKLKTAAIVLASVQDGKVQLAAGVTADTIAKVKAGDLVNHVAQQVGGKGGGKPDMAMAGGTDPKGLTVALKSVQAWVSERL